MGKKTDPLIEALRTLLLERKATSQEGICAELEKLGYSVNQTRISRLLRKVGAVKTINQSGKITYLLPREPSPPFLDAPIRNLIISIDINETLVIILTSPGSASMIARMLDYSPFSDDILGSIAGDDTIFLAPKKIHNLKNLKKQISSFLRQG
ncbi:MAG: hypothetical protein A3D96_05795 [Chlamydiae bacterium RIFCSPHIGHO2_12_FULL_44_59]|nr:MAG: hypothetical protein A2796_03625 [Chlamydiae bacterium RIFCSPHIGHO2_01_FULL_44_39]OGN59132.1 MAG: hypothetical protein A3C42_02640 [Chlamydiae bacterium RIFCSPHIGHO2_02_FULL_45_9]OGN61143.1 MAG: hypothetical protein A3D96_05795 [Chlamydiae bacterium RIFCSPHIGHO2_12_FULL_44_59]OGN65613.1 MAG: hypothetical protein A2978_06600 [Chlamydiae bacterium RIFCSPLOWO2_01_FULL_44_52]OGN68090.1 MAG: hypothetical protein A3I67_05270 [Chlamydiae bacterium RIFCSPLOWO2_02_FULL_45_22]OGN68979.1 MAG: hyp